MSKKLKYFILGLAGILASVAAVKIFQNMTDENTSTDDYVTL